MRILILLFLVFLLLPGAACADDVAAHAAECNGIPLTDQEYLRALAEQGDVHAKYALGTFYDNVRIPDGSDVHDTEALQWFRKAAEQGHLKAQNVLCASFHLRWQRRDPTVTSSSDDLKWCRKFAMEGGAGAQIYLADLYSKGEGVPQDYAEADFWFSVEGTHGSALYKEQFKTAEAHLTPEQKEAVEKRVREWKQPRLQTAKDLGLDTSEPLLINIAGLVCGGSSHDCTIEDSCGDLRGIVCPRGGYYIASYTSKKSLSSCGFGRTGGCNNLVPKEWTCGSPKNMPLSQEDALKYSHYGNMGDFGGSIISCGDILGVDNNSSGDGPYTFLNKVTGAIVGRCSYWHGACKPPIEWTCGRPSNYGG